MAPIRHVLPAAAALLVLIVAAMSAVPAVAGQQQGIRGSVTVGPTCPVLREGESCVKPFATTLHVRRLDAAGRTRTVKSGADGRFQVSLAAGRYRLTPASHDPYPHAAPQTVVVRAGRYTTVIVAYDSGIR